jgi:hypothetical protein
MQYHSKSFPEQNSTADQAELFSKKANLADEHSKPRIK